MAEENGTNSDIGSEENLTADVINLEIEEVGYTSKRICNFFFFYLLISMYNCWIETFVFMIIALFTHFIA